MPTTLRDVAARAGVTVTTVSRMLNNKCPVSPETRRRIEEAMRELDYRPNEVARSLAKQSSSFIGLIIPAATNFFFSTVIACTERFAAERGYKLLLCISDMDAGKEHELFQMLLSNKVAGIIVWSVTENLSDISAIRAPVVVVERTLDAQSKVPCVLSDNENGGRLGAEHLLERGCTRLAYFDVESDAGTNTALRCKGFFDVAQARGLPRPLHFSATWQDASGMHYRDFVRRSIDRIGALEGLGIMASNEPLASGIVSECLRRGLQVPSQVKVLGYDDTFYARSAMIPMTVIHQPIEEMCDFAVATLLRAAGGESLPTRAVFPVYLKQRETT